MTIDERHLISSRLLAQLKGKSLSSGQPLRAYAEPALILIACFAIVAAPDESKILPQHRWVGDSAKRAISILGAPGSRPFHEVWDDLLRSFHEWVHTKSTTPPAFSEASERVLHEVAGIVIAGLDGQSEELCYYTYDFVYRAAFQESSRQSISALAEFCFALASDAESVAEVSGWPGSIGSLLSQRNLGGRTPRQVISRGFTPDYFWLLRNKLARIEMEAADLTSLKSFEKIDFVFFDGARSIAQLYGSGNSQSRGLGQLAKSSVNFRLAVVVAPQGVTLGIQDGYEARGALIESGRLRAIVDIPNAASRPEVNRALWVLGPERHESDNRVLFVNARAVQAVGKASSLEARMAFVASIVRLFIEQETTEPSGQVSAEEQGQLRALLHREFAEGYRDVPGMCEAVSIERLRNEQYALSSGSYVSAAGSGIDELQALASHAIEQALFDRAAAHRCFYIIGNNGEGKSLFLRSIAKKAIAKGESAVGVSFGPTDRFEYAPSGQSSEGFTYLGLRTGPVSISMKKAAKSVVRLVCDIAMDQPRLDSLFGALSEVDFFDEIHLLPAVDDQVLVKGDEWYLGVRRLSKDAFENRTILSGIESNDFQLGLKRRNDYRAIVPFSQLSSGEQHVVGLLAKIVAMARPGAVMLLDEPETSLHLSWQRLLPALIARICKRFDGRCLIATHSPVIIANATSQEDQCYVAKDGALVPLRDERIRSLEGVVLSGFETYTANNHEIYERCAEAVSNAISLASADGAGQAQVVPANGVILRELHDMETTVRSALTSANAEAAKADLELIEKCRLAVREVFASMAQSDV